MAYTANIIPSMTSNTEPSGVVSGNYYSTYYTWKAFDGQHNVSAHDSSYLWGSDKYIQYQFTTGKKVCAYSLTMSSNNAYQEGYNKNDWYGPQEWKFFGSNNGSDWTELDHKGNGTSDGTNYNWTANTANDTLFEFSNTTSYTYYRMTFIIGSYVGAWVGIDKLEMFELALVAPNTPTNSSPSNAATGQSRNPTLTGGSFVTTDPSNPTHASSTWQVATDSGFSSVVWSKSTDTTNKTSIVVNATNGTFAGSLSGETKLASNTVYYWRVKYKDSNDQESAYSTGTSFTTTAGGSILSLNTKWW